MMFSYPDFIQSFRAVSDFMTALWSALPVEFRFTVALFFGLAVGYAALRAFIL